jgi:hypothetical protein
VFTAHSIRRPTIVTALAVALLGVPLSGPAAARPADGPQTSSLAGTTSGARQDLRSPDAIDASRRIKIALAMERYYQGAPGASEDAAHATERYYQSYGEPEPLVAKAPAPAPADDDAPLLPIALAAAALAVVAASVTHVRRLRIRRRRAAGALS